MYPEQLKRFRVFKTNIFYTMHIVIFQDFNYKFHWELKSSKDSRIDGSNFGMANKFTAINEAKHVTAAHGLIDLRILELTELREVKLPYTPLPETPPQPILDERFNAYNINE